MVSLLHQYGKSYKYVVSLLPIPETESDKVVVEAYTEVIKLAWNYDIAASKYGKAYVSRKFGERIYSICVED